MCDRRFEKRADGCSIIAVRNSVAQLKLRKSQREMSEFYDQKVRFERWLTASETEINTLKMQ